MNRKPSPASIAASGASALAILLAASSAAAESPPSSPGSLGPGRDETDTFLASRARDHADSGITFDMRLSALVPAGQYFDSAGIGMASFGPGSAVALSVGLHPLRHFGFLLGARGSFGHAGTGACSVTSNADQSCGGYSLQVPVMIELDATDRVRGFFLQAGLGLFTRYEAYGDAGTMSFSNDFAEYKATVGWRLPIDPGEARTPRYGLELFAGVDAGEFAHATFHDDMGVTSGAVGAPAWHYVFELGAGLHFTP